jgi:hypothetical protein
VHRQQPGGERHGADHGPEVVERPADPGCANGGTIGIEVRVIERELGGVIRRPPAVEQ